MIKHYYKSVLSLLCALTILCTGCNKEKDTEDHYQKMLHGSWYYSHTQGNPILWLDIEVLHFDVSAHAYNRNFRNLTADGGSQWKSTTSTFAVIGNRIEIFDGKQKLTMEIKSIDDKQMICTLSDSDLPNKLVTLTKLQQGAYDKLIANGITWYNMNSPNKDMPDKLVFNEKSYDYYSYINSEYVSTSLPSNYYLYGDVMVTEFKRDKDVPQKCDIWLIESFNSSILTLVMNDGKGAKHYWKLKKL